MFMVIKKYILSYIFFSYLFMFGAFCVEGYFLFEQSRILDEKARGADLSIKVANRIFSGAFYSSFILLF